MATVLLELPTALRAELKEPLGPIYDDAPTLLADAARPVIAVGDVVTYHLLEAGTTPAVALVDERTERAAVDPAIRERVDGFDREREVENPPATLTDDLLAALADAVDEAGTTLLRVDGEEDLAALAAVVAAPDGASVVYGQPGEGMVLVTCDETVRGRVRDLLERMDGDADAALAALGVERGG
ncbi:MAG: GTP-dependent dephospho-CoA kinase family protein [Haloarculaceae archaeon]